MVGGAVKNYLKERRRELGLTQPQVARSLPDRRVDVPLLSKFECGVCLPAKPTLEALETVLQAHRTELYERSDLDLLGGEAGSSGAAKRDRRSRKYLRKCYRVSRAFAATLPVDLFEACGYTSEQSWYDACMKRLLGEYANRKKGRKKEAV